MHWIREAFRQCEGHSCVWVRLKVSESWRLTFSAHPPSSHGSLCQNFPGSVGPCSCERVLLRSRTSLLFCLVRYVRPASVPFLVLLSGQLCSPMCSCGYCLNLPPCQQTGCISKCLVGKTTCASLQIDTDWACPPASCCVSSHCRNGQAALGLLGPTLLLFPCGTEQEVKVRWRGLRPGVERAQTWSSWLKWLVLPVLCGLVGHKVLQVCGCFS